MLVLRIFIIDLDNSSDKLFRRTFGTITEKASIFYALGIKSNPSAVESSRWVQL